MVGVRARARKKKDPRFRRDYFNWGTYFRRTFAFKVPKLAFDVRQVLPRDADFELQAHGYPGPTSESIAPTIMYRYSEIIRMQGLINRLSCISAHGPSRVESFSHKFCNHFTRPAD